MRRVRLFILLLLLIEFLDELIFGIREAAWPLIRDDLALTYVQIGLLLSLPSLAGSLIEPFIGILGDIGRRRLIVLTGGIFFTGSLVLTALSASFAPLLLSFAMFYPSSGAFVSLSQASLMDSDPARHEQNMARWTFAGSLGVVLGPVALGGAVALGLGWRGSFAVTAVLALALLLAARRFPYDSAEKKGAAVRGNLLPDLLSGFKTALRALRRREVLRWLVLLEFSDLMLDILLGFLALYMVDVAGATAVQAGIAVVVWSVVGLAGDFLLIPLLERVRGLVYLRASVIIELVLFPVFLLLPSFGGKLLVLGLLGLFNAGWYSILKGRLYASMPGQSGAVITLNSIVGFFATLIPLGIGALAQEVGLGMAMWALLLGPIALLAGIAGTIKPEVKEEIYE